MPRRVLNKPLQAPPKKQPPSPNQRAEDPWAGKGGKLRPVYTPPYIQTLSTWTATEVLSALDQHERGDFTRSGLLWQWMQRDGRLKAELNKLSAGIARLPFKVEAAGDHEPTPEEEAARATLEEGWFSSVPEEVTKSLIRTAVGMGVVAARVSWKVGLRGLWWPRLTVWPPEAIRFEDTTSRWIAKLRDGTEEEITPGDGRWLLWLPEGERGFQQGAVLALALPCLITLYNWRDWVNFNDAYGHPVRKATVPRGATTVEKNTFLANLKALDRTTNSILCQKNLDGSGFDFEFVSVKGGAEIVTFEKSMDKADRLKSLVIVGQTLTSDVGDSGSRALGDVHKEVKGEIIQALSNGLSTVWREQLVKPWAKYNYGRVDLSPWPILDGTPPKDKKADAETHSATADAAEKLQRLLKGSGKSLDVVAYLERLDLPLKDETEAPATPPAQEVEL